MGYTLYDLSQTDASNTSFAGISQAENTMKPSDVNNDFRAKDGAVARWLGDVGAVNTVAGTGDAITITLSQAFTAYGTSAQQIPTGALIRFIASAANTTAVTVNINTIGTKAIRKTSGGVDVALAAGDLAAGETYTMIYRSAANAAAGAWVLIGASAVASATTSAQGIVELATVAEALAGTDATRAVTPAGLYLPTGHLYGLTLSNGTDATNDIDITAGNCRDGADSANMVLASALTKQLDAAWAAGTNAGGLDTGSIADTTYHVWLIKRSDTGVVDALFSTSASAPTMPTSYDLKRRIGSIVRASSAILAFKQNGDKFDLVTPILDVAATNPGTSAVTRTLTVPVGIVVTASLNVLLDGVTTAAMFVYLSPLDVTDQVPSITAAPLATLAGNVSIGNRFAGTALIRTNTSAQIRSRMGFSGASDVLRIATTGWTDTRGRVS